MPRMPSMSSTYEALACSATTPAIDGRPRLEANEIPAWQPFMRRLIGHTDDVNDCALSFNGKVAVSCSDDHTVRVWDVCTGTSQVLKGHSANVRGCTITAYGNCVASCSDDCTVRLWRKKTPFGASWDDRKILSGDTEEGTSHTDEVNDCQFSSDGRLSDDKLVKVWSTRDGKCLHTLRGHQNAVFFCSVSANGSRILSGSRESKQIRVWSEKNDKYEMTEMKCNAAFSACAISGDGQIAAASSLDKVVRLWNVECHVVLQTLQHTWLDRDIEGCALTDDAQRVLSFAGTAIWVWSVGSGAIVHHVDGRGGGLNSCSLSGILNRGGRLLIGCTDGDMDGNLCVWNLQGTETEWPMGVPGPSWLKHKGDTGCTVTADGRRILVQKKDGPLQLCELETGKLVEGTKPMQVQELAQTVGEWLDTIGMPQNEEALTNFLQRGGKLKTSSACTQSQTALATTPADTRSTSFSYLRDIVEMANDPERMQDLLEEMDLDDEAEERFKASVEMLAQPAPDCSATDDGKLALSCGEDGSVQIWDTATGKRGLNLESSEKIAVEGVAVYDNNQKAMTCTADGTLRLYNLDSGELIGAPIQWAASKPSGCDVTDDGKIALLCSLDCTLRFCDLKEGSPAYGTELDIYRRAFDQPLVSVSIFQGNRVNLGHGEMNIGGDLAAFVRCADGSVRLLDLSYVGISGPPAAVIWSNWQAKMSGWSNWVLTVMAKDQPVGPGILHARILGKSIITKLTEESDSAADIRSILANYEKDIRQNWSHEDEASEAAVRRLRQRQLASAALFDSTETRHQLNSQASSGIMEHVAPEALSTTIVTAIEKGKMRIVELLLNDYKEFVSHAGLSIYDDSVLMTETDLVRTFEEYPSLAGKFLASLPLWTTNLVEREPPSQCAMNGQLVLGDDSALPVVNSETRDKNGKPVLWWDWNIDLIWKQTGREAKLRKTRASPEFRPLGSADDVSWGVPVNSLMVPIVGMGKDSTTNFTQLLQRAVEHAVSQRSPTIFESPALQAIVQFKWETICRDIFMIKFVAFTVHLLFFVALSLTNVDRQDVAEWPLTRSAAWLFCVIYTCLLLKQEVHQVLGQELAQYLADPYNYIDISGCVLTLISLYLMTQDANVTTVHALQAGAGLVSGVKVLFFLRGLDAFAFLIGMLEQVMRDMGNFIVVLFVILAAFSYAFYLLLHDSKLGQADDYEFNGIMALVATFNIMFGEFSVADFQNAPFAAFAVLLLTLFMLLVSIMMLNALIAIMGDTFERVQQHKTAAGVLERAKMIIELEMLLSIASKPPSRWQLASAALLSSTIAYHAPRYLHVLQPQAKADNDEWQGRMRLLVQRFDAMEINQSQMREKQQQAEDRCAQQLTRLAKRMDEQNRAMEVKLDALLALAKESPG